MKTNIILTICAVCLFSIMSATSQELTKKAIAFWKEKNGSLELSGKFCSVLIQDGTLKSTDTVVTLYEYPLRQSIVHNIPWERFGMRIGLVLQVIDDHNPGELLFGIKNGYSIASFSSEYNFAEMLIVAKDGITCSFDLDGTINIIEFRNGKSWSTSKQNEIEDIRKFFLKTVALYK